MLIACLLPALTLAESALPVIDGLALHLDASAVSDATSGTAVALWRDLSGCGFDATTPSGVQGPVWAPGAIGGKPALRFDGADDRLEIGTIRDSLGAVQFFMVSASDDTSGSNWQRLVAAWSGGPENEWVSPSWLITRPNSSGTPIAYGPTIFQLARSSGVEIDRLTLADGSKSSGARLAGDIAEVILFDRALTSVERENIGWHLGRKYGIATAYAGRPAVANAAPSHISPTGAVLRGRLGAEGESPCVVTVYWGANDGGESASWDASHAFPAVSRDTPAALQLAVSELTSDTTVYYRWCAENAAGTTWARQTDSFRTSPPDATVSDAGVREGNVGSHFVRFDVTLSHSWASPVSFDYATSNGLARAGHDYVSEAGTLTIPAGATASSIAVRILADLVDEGDESFALALSNPGQCVLANGFAVGTIWDDDRGELHVALDGDDSNPGTRKAPFATVARARDALRATVAAKALPEGGATVWIHEGDYPATETLTLGADDSGTSVSQIVYRAWPGDTVRLIGSAPLKADWFTSVTAASPVWHRLDADARDHLVQIDLAAHGITDFGTLNPRGFGNIGVATGLELFFDHKPMQIARWPNVGAFETTQNPTTDQSFAYTGTRPERWDEAEEIWFHGYYYHSWADFHLSGAVDTASKVVTLASPPNYGIRAGQPWYAWNLLEEIDTPGEWYLNRDTGILYLYPPAGIERADIRVSITDDDVLHLDGAQYVTFRDIVFEQARARLVYIDGGRGNRVYRSIVRNAGTDGVRVSGEDNGVVRCEIADVGSRGVALSGGNRLSLTPGGNFVEDSHIHRFSRWNWTYAPGVQIYDVGQRASHNWIHDAPHSAILYSGNEHTIDYNDIHDVCIYASDAGAVYSGRDWGYRGNLIKHNFVHHIASAFPGYGVHGVYLDDCLSGITVFGNVFYEISGYAIQHGGGRDDIMENNIIANCGYGVRADARGPHRIETAGGSWDLLHRIQQMRYQDEPWASAYPLLAVIPNNQAEAYDTNNGWLYPEGCRFSRNIGYNTPHFMYERDSAFSYYDERIDNLDGQNPMFVDEANLDLTLDAASPAYTIPGFTYVPFPLIGIREEPLVRVLAPIRVVGGSAVLRGEALWTGEMEETAEAILYWGTIDGGTTASNWPSSATLGLVGPDVFSLKVDGLATGTDYLYRARVANAEGDGWSASAASFHTGATAAPIARPNSYAVPPTEPLNLVAPGVLRNDTGDGPLTAFRIAGPWFGTLSLAPDGSLQYARGPGFTSGDWFTYRATDGQLESDTTTVTLRGDYYIPASVGPAWTLY